MREDIILQSGEQRQGKNKSIRTYFFVVDPNTSIQQYPNKSTALKLLWSKSSNTNDGSREYTQAFEVIRQSDVIIKMLCIAADFGRPKVTAEIYINYDPDAEGIIVEGINRFGYIQCRGKINKKLSPKPTLDLIQQGDIKVNTFAPVKKSNKIKTDFAGILLRRRR